MLKKIVVLVKRRHKGRLQNNAPFLIHFTWLEPHKYLKMHFALASMTEMDRELPLNVTYVLHMLKVSLKIIYKLL